MRRFVLLLILPVLVVAAATVLTARADDVTRWLWFDGENTYSCDDPFLEEGLSCWLTTTTAADCDGGGSCDWGWSEGVIYMHPVRLVVDLSSLADVNSATVYYWGTTEGDMRVFFYNEGDVVDEVHGESYGNEITVHTGGAAVDQLVVSACSGELYEIVLNEGGGTSSVAARHTLRLSPPFPNPSNPSCTLAFELREPAAVRLEIFDLNGRRVRALVAGELLTAGYHERRWHGRVNTGRDVASGVYVARLHAGVAETQQQVVLMK